MAFRVLVVVVSGGAAGFELGVLVDDLLEELVAVVAEGHGRAR